jgi:transmembrane sensor
MQQNDFDKQVDKYLNGTATAIEKKLVEEHFRVLEEMGDADIPQPEIEQRKISVLARIRKQMPVPHIPVYRKTWFRTAAAAILIIGLASTTYFVFNKQTETKPQIAAKTELEEIAPGRNGAILTLANGKQLLLDSAGNGQLATQGGVQVIKQNGELVYEGTQGEDLINTVSTNRGRQWSVVLPDGSKVWLNSASSIRYSLNFSGDIREVTTTGEVYFEVAKDSRRPFHVKTGDMDVTVLGTHFNVNAYEDENAIKTTLVEGSVKITKGDQQVLIKPGQQARLMNNGQLLTTDNIDLQQVLAWKTGFFGLNPDIGNNLQLLQDCSQSFSVLHPFHNALLLTEASNNFQVQYHIL